MRTMDFYIGAEQERSRIIALIDEMLQHLAPAKSQTLHHLRRQLYAPADVLADTIEDLRAGVRIAQQAAERD